MHIPFSAENCCEGGGVAVRGSLVSSYSAKVSICRRCSWAFKNIQGDLDGNSRKAGQLCVLEGGLQSTIRIATSQRPPCMDQVEIQNK